MGEKLGVGILLFVGLGLVLGVYAHFLTPHLEDEIVETVRDQFGEDGQVGGSDSNGQSNSNDSAISLIDNLSDENLIEVASESENVFFVWTGRYKLVSENNGNHSLENLWPEFPAPTLVGEGFYEPIADQIVFDSPGKWWIYENGRLRWQSDNFDVAVFIPQPPYRANWTWPNLGIFTEYAGYYHRSNGWKLLYDWTGIRFRVGMGFKARHVFQLPENIAATVTLRDNPYSSKIRHSFNIRYDIPERTTGDEVFMEKWGVQLKKVTENDFVMIENAYKKVVWKYKYKVLNKQKMKRFDSGI